MDAEEEEQVGDDDDALVAGEDDDDGDEDYRPEGDEDDEIDDDEEEEEAAKGPQSSTRKKRKPRQPNITFDEKVEAELIDWYRDHPEFYNSKLKIHKDTERKEVLMNEKAQEVGLESK